MAFFEVQQKAQDGVALESRNVIDKLSTSLTTQLEQSSLTTLVLLSLLRSTLVKMASTAFSILVSHMRHVATMTRCLLQRKSPSASAFERSLSTLPSATFFGNRVLDTRSDSSKPASSLYTYGKQNQAAVLVSGFTPGVLQIRWYESTVRPRLKCPGCYYVWRHQRKFVECSDHPRHKQMKTVATRKVWQEDYSKGDIQKAVDWHRRFPREFVRMADRNMVAHNWLASTLGKEV